MKTTRHSLAFLALFSLFALFGCDSLGLDSSQQSATGIDGGVCSRDLGAIQDLLAHPKACAGAAQCPSGTFCNADEGRCDWQCTQDSECGTGNKCNCDGRCSNSTGPNNPSATS